MRMTTAVAIGSSVTVGLSIYLFLGAVYGEAGTQAPSTYILTLIFLLPLVLTLAERSSVTPGSGGIFNLSRSAGSVPLAFITGWSLLGGLFGLAALFAWEGGLVLSRLISLFFTIELEGRWLSALLIFLVLLRFQTRTSGIWKRRSTFVYAAIILLSLILFTAWFAPIDIPSTWIYIPSSNLLSSMPYLVVGLWGLHLVLDRRDELRQPRKRMLPALLLPIVIGSLAGAAAAATLLLYPSLTYLDQLPLVSLAQKMHPLLAVLVLLAMFLFSIIGTNESLSSLMKLSTALGADGFLPEQLQRRRRIWPRPFYTRLLFVTITPLLLLLLPPDTLVVQTAIAIVLAVMVVNIQDLFRSKSKLAHDRWPKLPFHPLFPGMAAALGITIILSQDLDFLLLFMPWIIVGVLLYVFYAREGAITVRRRDVMVAGSVLPAKKTSYRVMIAISDPSKAASLIRLGAQIASVHGGLLAVLQVTHLADDEAANQQRATAALKQLNDLIPPHETVQVPITPMVRLATDATHGILTTIWEEKIDIVVLGWPAERVADVSERDGTIGQIVRKAQCEVVVLHGDWQGAVKRILVPVVSAGHSQAALLLGKDLSTAQDEGGQIVALRVLTGKLTEEKKRQAEQQLYKTRSELDDPSGIEGEVIGSKNTKEGILQEAGSYDALLLGLSEEGFLAATDFSGLPVDVALAATPPTLLVKRQEKPIQYWLRRSWDELSAVLPTLSVKRKAIVGSEMRTDGKAGIDFYVLMVLAASIALFGLIQNSAAVIIGAMLVAPLMSPILAMAHSIVRGQLKMLRQATESAVNGIVLAITVAALLSLFLVALGIPIPPTNEILARTQPNFLDLLVALASGAAAAYAISRSEVSAALPGVAIAAALVPPLAVVGYGLGTAQFNFAAGSMLLFLTNLAAIVLAAAVVFLLLGIRPPARDDRDEQARFGLKMAIVAMVLISIPLFATTRISANQAARDQTVSLILENNWPPTQAQVVDIVVTEERNKDLSVTCTIFDYAGVVSNQAVAELQVEISNALDEPVILSARTIYAQVTNFDDASSARLLAVTPAPTDTETPESMVATKPPPAKTPRPTATDIPQPTITTHPIISATSTPQVTATVPLEISETPEPSLTETAAPTPVETIQPGMTLTPTLLPTLPAVP